jgi:hypothetical protein
LILDSIVAKSIKASAIFRAPFQLPIAILTRASTTLDHNGYSSA